ncbi:MAG: hypothetical protein IKQ60_09570 [Candidatus Methanomethylophilaceae archaeon]|nr:hypothetical protein [Candidatus Methanomethylophilaceae archaeon]
MASDAPASTILSTTWTATAPATPAIGPTPEMEEALHIRRTSSSSLESSG